MRTRRYFRAGAVHFITFRTEEGLPFVPVKCINMLLLSALARACRLYPVQLIAVVVQANHVHMLIRIIDPEHASAFIGYFKTETANCLNRLLNRRQRTVWLKRFNSPIVLDIHKALDLFAYTLLNPVKDGLVDSMSEYPGVSSYSSLMQDVREISVKSIPRSCIPKIKDPTCPLGCDAELSSYFSSDSFGQLTLKFEPEALRMAYAETKGLSPDKFRQMLLGTLQKKELEYRLQRKGRPCVGARKLVAGSMLASHTPPVDGRKMLCLSSIPELRKNFIRHFRSVCARCRSVFLKWRDGDLSVSFPPGMFAPSTPRLANLCPRSILSGYS
jgi:REP element-mobilizing transposase RayT